jgi:Lhr-like helicase
VATFVAHSSLGLDERHQAERAFASGRACVIVATSALELGIDVGDLDRVIQVDAPPTVSSFLQRMGRTGRRPGTTRNCLFLATSDEGLLRAAGLIELWRSGFVEPAVPPPEPLHIFAQQIMALALQERGIGRAEWFDWIGAVPAFGDLDRGLVHRIFTGMLEGGSSGTRPAFSAWAGKARTPTAARVSSIWSQCSLRRRSLRSSTAGTSWAPWTNRPSWCGGTMGRRCCCWRSGPGG